MSSEHWRSRRSYWCWASNVDYFYEASPAFIWQGLIGNGGLSSWTRSCWMITTTLSALTTALPTAPSSSSIWLHAWACRRLVNNNVAVRFGLCQVKAYFSYQGQKLLYHLLLLDPHWAWYLHKMLSLQTRSSQTPISLSSSGVVKQTFSTE